MSDRPDLPAALRTHLETAYGAPATVERLGGMSGGAVWRLHYGDASVIVKRGARPNERLFYEQVAPGLAGLEVATPHREWSGTAGRAHWLVLEDIPDPLPRDRWSGDPELLGTLLRLHSGTLNRPPALPDLYRPLWTDEHTQRAVGAMPVISGDLARRLRVFQRQSERLAQPLCWLSGDPNPTNWGLRAGGELVLFDWERFGIGSPALDLAISVPGLGSTGEMMAVAGWYLRGWYARAGTPPWTADQLVEDMLLAKVWSVVEFLGDYAAGRVAGGEASMAFLAQTFPGWLRSLPAN